MLDLKNEKGLIAEYESQHATIWPEVLQSFEEAGIEHLQMYRLENRVVMIFDVNETFSFEKKELMDRSNPVIRKWEALMSTYQEAEPGALANEKWRPMKRFVSI